jgi:rSAM/selenodomain-associated transferase 1
MNSRGSTPARPELAPEGAQEAALIVFARAPEPGRVKTRLVPLLGKKGAARLHARLVERTLRTGTASGFDAIYLYCSPRIRNGFFRKMNTRFGVRLCSLGHGNLGDRMYHAFKRALRGHAFVVLIGSDCPALRPADLRAAARALREGADAVLAPAEDGGYPLIGLRRVNRRLFDGIAWGSPRVLAQTRRRLEALRWRWQELRTVWDVDRPEDVLRLRRSRLLRTRNMGTEVPPLPSPRARPTSSTGRRRAPPSSGNPSRSDGPGRTSARRS